MDDQSRPPLRTRTLTCQSLGAGDVATGAIVAPIHMSATYLRDPDNGYSSGYVYGRTDHRSVQQAQPLFPPVRRRRSALGADTAIPSWTKFWHGRSDGVAGAHWVGRPSQLGTYVRWMSA